MSFIGALAICASSSSASACATVSDAKRASMMAVSSGRLRTRAVLLEKRSSCAKSRLPSTVSQKLAYSRSFCTLKITLPLPVRCTPYGAMVGCEAPKRAGGLPP
ncbi:hypothetical protein D3C81_1332010 [compost metagenome]